jgi:DNA-binding transcriptional MerR regulator
VSASVRFLSPSEAAKRLGVSAKALRLYEERGLVSPVRTAAGWRTYGPAEMRRAAEISALRALGVSLAKVERVLKGDADGLEPTLAAHQASLEGQLGQLSAVVGRVRAVRRGLVDGQAPAVEDLARLAKPALAAIVAFELPWPWGGERFELREMRAINYIVGPLGSGKTRLAQRLVETLPSAALLGLERSMNAAAAQARMDSDAALKARVDSALAWIVEGGAKVTGALIALLIELETDGPDVVVIDMIEQGLDEAAQQALIAHLRRRGSGGRPLFVLTRSSAILNLEAIGPDETIILCPANHSPPISVAPYPGAPGYEAVVTCLASPIVRARTEGVIASRPEVA